jgi:hypothetical protein
VNTHLIKREENRYKKNRKNLKRGKTLMKTTFVTTLIIFLVTTQHLLEVNLGTATERLDDLITLITLL